MDLAARAISASLSPRAASMRLIAPAHIWSPCSSTRCWSSISCCRSAILDSSCAVVGAFFRASGGANRSSSLSGWAGCGGAGGISCAAVVGAGCGGAGAIGACCVRIASISAASAVLSSVFTMSRSILAIDGSECAAAGVGGGDMVSSSSSLSYSSSPPRSLLTMDWIFPFLVRSACRCRRELPRATVSLGAARLVAMVVVVTVITQTHQHQGGRTRCGDTARVRVFSKTAQQSA